MIKKLEQLISALEKNIPAHTLTQPAISSGSVGWHIEHALLSINAIIHTLSKSNPADYKHTFDMRRVIVLMLGKIPRGKARAPKAVQPGTDFNELTLHQHIKNTREKIKLLEQLPANSFFRHPFLGDFKRRQAIKFIIVHTKHHLSIIKDIRNAR